MRKIVSLLVAVLCVGVYADNIRWLTTDYDFGTWSEMQGPRTGSVRFINEGPDTTFVRRVRTSCGCTGADFPKGPILPGDTAVVFFTYNPAGRPGEFEKTVKVYTGEDSRLTTINIHGVVIGRPESLDARYPFSCGAVRLGNNNVEFGKVPPDRLRHDFIQAYNQTGDTIRPMAMELPDGISVNMSSDPVLPGRYFSVGICLDTSVISEPGNHEHEFFLISDSDNTDESIPVRISFDVEQPVISLSPEELAVAPVVRISPSVIEIKPKSGRKVKFRFRIENAGQSMLTVRRMIPDMDHAVRVEKFPVRLAPGKSGWAEGYVEFPAGHISPFSGTVKVYTSDPLRPEVTVRICGKY